MSQGRTTTNDQLKPIKLRIDNSKSNDDLMSPTSSMCYTSDYAPYPRLAPEDLIPVPDPFASLPNTPPRTPPPTPVAIDGALKIDRAFTTAALRVKHHDMTSHVAQAFGGMNNDNKSWALIQERKMLLLYVLVLISGVLFGLYV